MPHPDRQKLRILLEDFLVAEGRYRRNPTAEHKAEVESCRTFLEQAGSAEDLDERWQKFARGIASDRLADDEHYGRCMCRRCKSPQTSSVSHERVPADHGRELPRAAAS